MESEHDERSTYLSHNIGFIISGEAVYNPAKYEEYAASGMKVLRNIRTSDARFKEVREQAERLRLEQLGAYDAIPDLFN